MGLKIRIQWDLLTWTTDVSWLLVKGPNPPHVSLSLGLPKCPHNMVTGFLQSEIQEKARWHP